MGERTAVLYPDGTKAAYEYNGAMQLTAMKVFSGEKQEQTVRYSYDEAGRLAGKQFPGGSTEYRYSQAGRIGEILHKGADFTERLRYAYDVMGNKVTAEKDRPGSPEDSGIFSYGYDELNRLTGVAQNGKILRSYSYDAFGNRSSKTEYQTAGSLTTTYRYNARNQLIQETAADTAKDYAYDHRGNLLSVTSGGEVLRAYGFDAANQMESAMEMEDGRMKKAACQYNGLGHRMGQSITAAGGTVPDRIIRYTLDLTRQYHNLLQKTTSMGSGGSRTEDRRYDAGAGRFISEDFIKGHTAVPYTMNHYSYCFNRPMDLVDLNGMWPKWVETTVKAVTVVTTVVAVGAVVVGTGGTAAPFIAGVLLAGTIGGFANENIGGSYSNGFFGGCFTGIIQGAGSMLGPIGNTIGGGIGSAVGTMVTEYLDNIDSTVEKKHEEIGADALTSGLKGLVWGTFTGSVQGITFYNDVALEKNVVDSFSGYTKTTGNVLNTFYGATTTMISNESSFDKE